MEYYFIISENKMTFYPKVTILFLLKTKFNFIKVKNNS